MKKIYILTAVLALLTLSLNAQTMAKKAVKSPAQAGNGSMKAPNRGIATLISSDFSNANWWTILSDNQGNTWQISNQRASYLYNTYYAANDWLVTPSVALEAGQTYTFNLDEWVSSQSYPEKLEVKIASANTAAALSSGRTIYAENFFTNTSSSTISKTFTVPTSGNYYIGIHVTSDADMGTLYVDNMSVTYDNSPKIVVSPKTLTINDSGTNNTFTVQGYNLGSDNVGVTVPDGSGFTRTTDDQYWGFENNNGSVSGTATIGYEGRDLSASTTVSVGNNLTSTTVAVTYRADLYIVGNFGNDWDFDNGTPMTYNSDDNTYTANVTVDANNLFLFARKLGESNPWNTRIVFGPNSNGDWVLNGDSGSGTIDLYDDDPIKIVNAGTYTVTINATTGALTIEKQVLPPPVNVAATADSENQKATVTWSAPSTLPTVPGIVDQKVTENFDDTSIFEPFSLGGISADDHIGAFGGWTLYDPTGKRVWGVSDGDFANMSEAHAWFVMNPSQATGIDVIAHSPEQYLESICPLENDYYHGGAADHWLISPELSGNAQTISFYERVITTDYGNETYEILVSSSDINSADPSSGFTVLQTVNSSATTWTLRSFELPAGTKHFAIHHISNNIFGMMVDDIEYNIGVPGQVTINPVSYNVYLDGEQVGNVPADQALTYTFSNLATGDHECAVSAVYEVGESALVPAEFTIMERTATPTITVVANADGSKTVSATGNGTVKLYVDGEEVTNPYTIPASSDGDKTYTVTATAKEEDKLISETAEEIVTVAEAGRTPMPVIQVTQETNGTVVITATGDGHVTLTVDGQTAYGEGTATITIVKSTEEREVTATATAQDGDLLVSHEATKTITIPALTGSTTTTAEGLLRLHLLILDQMKEEIPDDNSHPDHYGYVLRYEPNGAGGEGTKESSTVRVDIQKTDCTVEGKYTLDQIDNDKNIGSLKKDDNDNIIVNNGIATILHDQGLTMGIYSADVNFDLTDDNPDVDFYMLERDISTDNPDAGFSYVTKLQQTTNFTYVEMLSGSAHEGEEYLAGPHYFNDEILTGEYGDFVRYAPVVSTWGVTRRYYEYDGLDNTYGAPLWKTGVAEVTMSSADIEPQDNAWHSVTWTDADGAARLYMLDKVTAVGKLPNDYSTVKYEPYMFRIFVESPSGSLRNYKLIEGSDDQGEHLEADATSEEDKYGPRCVWSGYIKDIPETTTENNPYGMTLGISGNEYTFTKNKVDRTGTSHDGGIGNEDWDKDDVNAMFGALTSIETGENQNISVDDIKVFVRFYYNVKGMAAGHEATSNNDRSLRADDETRPGYGAESDAKAPKQTPTSVFEIAYHGEVVGQTYYNVQGMESDKPFEGINIVVTRYSDGTTSVTKVVR